MRNSAARQRCTAVNDVTTRRDWLSATMLQSIAVGAIHQFWSGIAQANAAPMPKDAASNTARPGRAKSVILIFNCGAPSHIDLWDMKPAAADNIRGLFQPISTNVPGIQISELM